MFATKNPVHPDIADALRECRRAFASVALFSGMVNLLMLAGPLYMLQVYDRVLSSRSVPTLIALSIFLVGAYAFQGVLDLIRSRVVVRSAAVLDQRLALAVHSAVIRLSVTSRHPGDGPQPVRDLDAIRGFLTGAGPIAIVDLPWVPVFLTICFLIHPWLGVASTIGAVALFTMTLLTERASRAPAKVLAQDAGRRSVMVEAQRRGGETIMAMGMGGALAQRWAGVNNRYIAATASLSDVAGGFGSASKVLRLLLQSVILGLGAYLVIRQEMTAGAMVAASIMMGRALAPIETAIANWRAFIGARQSITRLSEALTRAAPKREVTSLPRPERSLEVEHVAIVAPGGTKPVVVNVRFALKTGQAVGIIGPSGAGKTSLVRALVGIWRPAKGCVRLDGAALDQWDPDLLGQHVGFISQTVELFDGTISENIARMNVKPDADAVLRAAKAAGAHELILRLAQWLRHPDRRRRRSALGRTASAHRFGARALWRPFPGRARRAQLQSRQRGRDGFAPGHHQPQEARRHCRADRASAIGAGRLRPYPGACQRGAEGFRVARRDHAEDDTARCGAGGGRQSQGRQRHRGWRLET